MQMVLLTAVYNDWLSFTRLIKEVDEVLQSCNVTADFVIVDDGSDEEPLIDPDTLASLKAIRGVDIISLVANLGNQRAVAVGISYIGVGRNADALVLMDADGEDRPGDLVPLLEKFRMEPESIVVASREKRQDGIVFRTFYAAYKGLYRLLTGRAIDFGNYSIMPQTATRRLAMMPDLWVHFPTAVLRSRMKLRSIPTARGKRYMGTSSMSFVPLMIHGISGIVLNSETAVVRLLIGLFAMAVLLGIGILAVVGIRVFAEVAVPGWASTMVGWMVAVIAQLFMGALVIMFLVVGIKTLPPFSPALHYRNYIAAIRKLR